MIVACGGIVFYPAKGGSVAMRVLHIAGLKTRALKRKTHTSFKSFEDQSFPIASRVHPELAAKGAYNDFEQ